MRIFTSYFARIKSLQAAGITPVSIARINPKWIPEKHIAADLKSLAPTPQVMILPEEEYIIEFDNQMRKIKWKNILMALKNVSRNGDVALLCYEKPSDFCHRHIVARWIFEQTGYPVKEWEPENEKPKTVQQTLF